MKGIVEYNHIITVYRSLQKGQDVAEYALLVAMITLVVLLGASFLGSGISEFLSNVSVEISGMSIP